MWDWIQLWSHTFWVWDFLKHSLFTSVPSESRQASGLWVEGRRDKQYWHVTHKTRRHRDKHKDIRCTATKHNSNQETKSHIITLALDESEQPVKCSLMQFKYVQNPSGLKFLMKVMWSKVLILLQLPRFFAFWPVHVNTCDFTGALMVLHNDTLIEEFWHQLLCCQNQYWVHQVLCLRSDDSSLWFAPCRYSKIWSTDLSDLS